jgi:hypothetical protein
MRWVTIGFLLAIGLASPAAAIMNAPEPINTPVRDEWRRPFESFLREMKVEDFSSLIARTSAFEIGGVWQRDWILFRVEDPKTCYEDRCFTVIGRIVDSKFVPSTMFSAGKHFTYGDTFIPLFGFQVRPAWLVGDTITMVLLETPQGWIAAPTITSKELSNSRQ